MQAQTTQVHFCRQIAVCVLQGPVTRLSCGAVAAVLLDETEPLLFPSVAVFYKSNTQMLLGDAKAMCEQLKQQVASLYGNKA